MRTPPAPFAPSAPDLGMQQALRTDRERTLTQLYRQTFPLVRRHVLRHSGSAQDAQDVFHDALIIFYEKAVHGSLTLTAAPSTYLVSVCRNLWHRELARRSRQPSAELHEDHLDFTEPIAAEPETATASGAELVLDYVEKLGTKCRSILVSFYYFNEPLEQIAATHQYSSVRSATVQKFKCLERLRNAVRKVATSIFAHQDHAA
ncbi:sigma-70 family RNA polymerase sigma factor [Hymenobacter sp. GOD-10R]|uniref:RNA polymerase sigma factor n=1 Tax=Hymenobacter sp. GOD-10R TaxID=3093922 RepID=UPI002D78EBED|nr:sigma-70 family RNA polymerase sigma factor [Hymenobacter sp. GOD-10R]WRQ27549.1 sigma-70 family RNA polymerase sigma factor [Hymenobacter sp. GOD-10R]